MHILLFCLLACPGFSIRIGDSQGCDPALASCETPPAVPADSTSSDSSSTLGSFSSDAPSVTFIDPVDTLEIPNPGEFEPYDMEGMPVFVGAGEYDIQPGDPYSLSGSSSFSTTTPPPYSTIALTWTNQATFNSSLALFSYIPEMSGLDTVKVDGAFVRELRRRLTT